MYLSRLKLNRMNRDVLFDLSNPYEMHRTLARAFPDGVYPRFLFRIEEQSDSPEVTILVSSDELPDWTKIHVSEKGSYLNRFDCMPYDVNVSAGLKLKFRLLANPTKKLNGSRIGLLEEGQQSEWIKRKGEQGGFRLMSLQVIGKSIERVRINNKNKNRHHEWSHVRARFEGVLEVTDPAKFSATIKCGIGHGKSMGFGLLSVANL